LRIISKINKLGLEITMLQILKILFNSIKTVAELWIKNLLPVVLGSIIFGSLLSILLVITMLIMLLIILIGLPSIISSITGFILFFLSLFFAAMVTGKFFDDFL